MALSFSVCPHNTEKGRARWLDFKNKLQNLLGEDVNIYFLSSYKEEIERINVGNFFDIYYASPLVSLKLYKMGYKPVAKFEGQKDTYFLIKSGEIPKEGFIEFASPFLKPLGYTLIAIDIDRIKVKLVYSFEDVLKLLKEGKAHVGIMYGETWEEIDNNEKEGISIIEGYTLESSHVFMVKPQYYPQVRYALFSMEELEPFGKKDMERIHKIYSDFEKFLKLWSNASIALALKKASNVGIFIYQDRIVYTNQSFLNMTGYSFEELNGKDIFKIVDSILLPEYRPMVKEVVSRRIRGEDFNMTYSELPLIRKDGTLLWTIASSETILYGGDYAGVVFFVDISKKKRLERLYKILREVNQLITKVIFEEELFSEICHKLVEVLGLKFVWIGVPDLQKERIKPLYAHGHDEGYLSEIIISIRENVPEGRGPTGRAYRENKIYINENTLESPMSAPWREKMLKRGYLSSCTIPIEKDGKVAYLLNLYAGEAKYFQEETVEVLYELKHDLEFALKKIEDIRKNTLISTALENSSSWVLITNEDGTITYANKAVSEISGYSQEELYGKKPKLFKSGYHTEEFYKKLWDSILSGREFRALFVNKKKNGEYFYLDQTIYPLVLSEGVLKFISIGSDVTKEKKLYEEVERLSRHDVLTGVLNHYGFRAKIEELQKDLKYAFLTIDICNMSMINKQIGTEGGNKVLKTLAERLKEYFGKEGIICRSAGDEFSVIVEIEKKEDVIKILEDIKEIFRKPIHIDGGELSITTNIGIALYPYDAGDFEELQKKANTALNMAKKSGEGEVRFFETSFEEKFREMYSSMMLVSKAVEQNLFTFHYQPYFTTDGLELVGFEALARIKDKEGKIHSPAEFIDYLENSIYINFFEKFLVEKAIEFVRKYHISLSINISARSFKKPDFIKFLVETIDGQDITVEITERVFPEDYQKALKSIEILKKNGIKVAIDDFGTGYSSLAYISEFDVDIIKIDTSFIQGMLTDLKKRTIVNVLTRLAEKLNTKTLAEGVETENQLKLLREMHCDYVQGYLLGKPMPEEDVYEFIKNVKRLHELADA